MSKRTEKLEALFEAALALESVAQQQAYLNRACPEPDLRREVESLLAAHGNPDSVLVAGRDAADTRASVSITEQPGDQIGRYKLLEKLGEGGFGVVYMAEQREPVKRRVALKIIKVGMDTREVVARFEAERQALAMMDHPNIAKVFDAGSTERPLTPYLSPSGGEGAANSQLSTSNSQLAAGRPYFVMELVRGIRITDYCDQNQLGLEERLKLFMQVCQAVQHAHQKGIIHRDLKPSNILVTLHDGVPVPKVIDFGIAKATQQELTEKTLFTQFHQFIGTPSYMSPEQAELSGLDIDTRSDIYSLGVLLYELLAGKPPFDGQELLKAGLDEMRRTLREVEPPKPSTRLTQELVAADVRRLKSKSEIRDPKTEEEIRASSRRLLQMKELVSVLRGDLDWIVMKCLEKDRSRRYETANGLVADIQRHLSNEPIMARPPSAAYRFQKMASRNKVMFAAASAVLLALASGAAISTWQAIRATRAEREQSGLRLRAETEAAISAEVSSFLQEMLQGVRPSIARGRDTTVLREILDNAAGELSRKFNERPEVEARVRSTIGGTYFELGEYEKAEAMHRAALGLRRQLYGNSHSDASDSRLKLAEVLFHWGRLAEAEALSREELDLERQRSGNEHLTVAELLCKLAMVLDGQEKLAEAESARREALAIRRKRLGEEHPDVADSLADLASSLERRGDWATAEAMNLEALRMFEKSLGREISQVATILNNLALALAKRGEHARAESMLREALSIHRKLLGNEHNTVAFALYALAVQLGEGGKLAEAESLHREALAMRRKLLDAGHPDVANSLNGLAYVLQKQGKGKLSESESLHREALARYRSRLGDRHSTVVMSLNNLAQTLRFQGRLTEAEALLREAITVEESLPEHRLDPKTYHLRNLAAVFRAQGKLAEAEPVLRKRLVIDRTRYTNAPAKLDGPISDLMGVLHGQGKYAEAETLCRELLQSRLARLPATNDTVVGTTADLAWILADWAWEERTNSVSVRNANSEASQSLVTSAATAVIARAREAERLLRDCLAARAQTLQPDNSQLADTRSRLGSALLIVAITGSALGAEARLSKFTEAERLLQEGNEGLPGSGNAPPSQKRDTLAGLVRLYEA